jgi:hypothetical protein
MTAAPGIISVDRGKTKVAHPVEGGKMIGALRKGGWNGAGGLAIIRCMARAP